MALRTVLEFNPDCLTIPKVTVYFTVQNSILFRGEMTVINDKARIAGVNQDYPT